MSDRVKQVLLADGVKPESVSPYLAAWTWAESGKATTGLSVATVRTYEAGPASAHSGDPRFPDSQAREGPSWCQASSLLPIISALRLFLARALE
jgi:hypothetical protein